MRTMVLEYESQHLPHVHDPVLQVNIPAPWSIWDLLKKCISTCSTEFFATHSHCPNRIVPCALQPASREHYNSILQHRLLHWWHVARNLDSISTQMSGFPGESPIAGWFISWKIPFKWMIEGVPSFQQMATFAGNLVFFLGENHAVNLRTNPLSQWSCSQHFLLILSCVND